jgi:hypothetical protein
MDFGKPAQSFGGGVEVGLRWGLRWPMRKKSPFGIKKIKKNVAFEPFLRLLN